MDAQTTSTVRGHVAGAGAGSTVTVTDLNTGHVDLAKVDASGNYLIVGLPAEQRTGCRQAGTSQVVVVPLGQAVTVDLVRWQPPTLLRLSSSARTDEDVKTPAVTTNVSLVPDRESSEPGP